jgi:hypothetical protein
MITTTLILFLLGLAGIAEVRVAMKGTDRESTDLTPEGPMNDSLSPESPHPQRPTNP